MDKEPVRTCPIDRCRMEPVKGLDYREENGYVWQVYDCPNCTTQVWLVPFKGYCDSKR